ncbi:MAG: hypothetical protein A3H25_16030 [Sphingomonadales bacterium RIFCSPLOWO2_12_FULL_63_15]|nr:MAG: hypothetical protein A3H25_16030 [Sphingomonadales bacterium RIFCSPLOWO2_12_FULL_63_15]
MTDPALIDALVAKQQIADLTAAYCRGVDRADAALLGSLFHADSHVESGPFNGSGQDFAREICAIVRTVFTQTSHANAHQWVEIDGDSAKGETYVTAAATPRGQEGDPIHMLTGGRYLDRFVRTNGTWQFIERRFVCDWVVRQPAGGGDDLYAGFLRGAQGPSDPVHSLWGNTAS